MSNYTRNKKVKYTRNKKVKHTRNKKIKHTHNKKLKYTRNKKVKHTKNKTIKNYVGGISNTAAAAIINIFEGFGLGLFSLFLLPFYLINRLISLLSEYPLSKIIEDITNDENRCKEIFPNNDSCDKSLSCYISNNKNCKWKEHVYINGKEGEIISRFNRFGNRFVQEKDQNKIKDYIGDFIKKLIIIFEKEKQEKKQKDIIKYFTKKNVRTQIKLLEILLYNNEIQDIEYKLLRFPKDNPNPWDKRFILEHFSLNPTSNLHRPLMYDTIDKIKVLIKKIFIDYITEIKDAIKLYNLPNSEIKQPINITDNTIKNIIDTLYQIIKEKIEKIEEKGEGDLIEKFNEIKKVYS